LLRDKITKVKLQKLVKKAQKLERKEQISGKHQMSKRDSRGKSQPAGGRKGNEILNALGGKAKPNQAVNRY